MQQFAAPNLKPFYADPGESARDVTVALPGDLRYVHRVTRRTVREQLRVANAAKSLDRLPEPGESLHVVCKGNWAAWDLVPAVLRLAAPAKIRRLHVATLGFSRKNIAELAGLMDARTIREVWFLFSCYFRSTSAGESDFADAQLAPRGANVASVRTHSKLLLLDLTDGRHVTVETSANLRSCRNIEQFTIATDRALWQFHRTWIEAVIREARQ